MGRDGRSGSPRLPRPLTEPSRQADPLRPDVPRLGSAGPAQRLASQVGLSDGAQASSATRDGEVTYTKVWLADGSVHIVRIAQEFHRRGRRPTRR
jgi:hypothetical protein